MGTRRSDGEGTAIRKGDDGRWHASLSFGVKSGGRRDRRHVSGKTRAECAAKLRTLQAKRDAGVVPSSARTMTVASWLVHWLDNIAAAKVRPSTLDGYRQYVTNRLVPALGHHRLNMLQPEHVEAFYRDATHASRKLEARNGKIIELKPLSSASILQCHRILSRALKVAVQRDMIARNVCTLVDAPSLVRAEVEPLTSEDAKAILKSAATERNGARWSVALALGLRQGEALGLRWRDVNLDAGTLRVRKALQRQSAQHGCGSTCGRKRATDCPQRRCGGLKLVEVKSDAGRRTIVLPSQLLGALKRHRADQEFERDAAGSEWVDLDFVFCQLNGKPLDPRHDWGLWKELLRTSGVRDARLHDARHTAATLLLRQGVSPRVVMQILGHSQITLTLGTYSHVVPELAADAAEQMNDALWGEEETRKRFNGHRSGTENQPETSGGEDDLLQ